ncbi:tRNA epoxyqueuosine(34) reductase QueG [Roseomonas gilardii subsp. gilardii]|uniref:tRNA epoxyqueuosine(34) reductase QueG n=1 Tax=Roseomonas gilardii TaxID=257708 RepID=UPI001FFBC971|nr:tRNA epoxyqueuosine(34) reductase QueG [Roseomonas gilardii]UPG71122.1 tRNA epoxyqueuosine(34) reductase QueG [Roseomonas gilardii subsp. gilardii]
MSATLRATSRPDTASPAPPAPGTARDAIRDEALRLGFDAVGFARAHLGPEVRERLGAFLEAGMHGEMGWLAERAEQRSHPRALWPEAVSVISLGMNYGPEEDPLANLSRPDRGTISVYARHRDYHDVVKKRLKALARWMMARFAGGESPMELKVFVDTAPVAEKPLAQQAGIGWQGKHSNLVSRAHGSWLFLGEVYTTLDLAPDAAETDHCGQCHRCLTACPTDAFLGPYRLDARRCVSYLTIEHKGPVPEALRPRLGNRIYGCDDCLAACPWNKFARAATEPALIGREDLAAPRLADLAVLDDAAFRALFSGSPIKRIGRDRFVRNVLYAIGNSADPSLLPEARRLAGDPDPVVAEAAAWAVSRLENLTP